VHKYIHMNPVNEGLVESPTHYEWSSAYDYVKKGKKRHAWLFSQELKLRVKKFYEMSYVDFRNLKLSKEVEQFYSKNRIPSILGSDKYVEFIKKHSVCADLYNSEMLYVDRTNLVSIRDFLDIIANYYNVDINLVLKNRYRKKVFVYYLMIFILRTIYLMKIADIAKIFGCTHYSTISKALNLFKEQYQYDSNVITTVLELRNKLILD
jgi:putative transposase